MLEEQMVLALVEHHPVGIVGPVLHGAEMELRPVAFVVEFFRLRGRNAGLVAHDDLIDVDVSPASAGPIDDLDAGLLAGQFADVPCAPVEPLVVVAGRCANDLAINEQIDACLAFVGPSANEEVEELALDLEGRRGERAGRGIAIQVGVDQALA